MASVHDVAAYILGRCGRMSAMKLQKLLYYAQAWSLAMFGRPVFDSPIQAWSNGPVIQEVFDKHRGSFILDSWQWGRASEIRGPDLDAVEHMLHFMEHKTAGELSRLTHLELPWLEARKGLGPSELGHRTIRHEHMASFYAERVKFQSNPIVQFIESAPADELKLVDSLLDRDREYGMERAPDERG